MRPLNLKLNGLRSYTAEQDIDFSTVGLMAVIGDTGAGKSSILEALCFALYGGCTWDQRNAVALIADGVNTMRVQLTFRCRNKTWQVTRSASRSTSPPAHHELLCLDDGTRYDAKRQVDAVVEQMIGLSYKAFLKAVILPQGRFQALLQTTSTDRTAILKSILGIDQLDAMHKVATASHDRMRPLLEDLARRRAALLPDPAAAADDATQRLAAAEQRRQVLTEARAVVARAAAQQEEIARHVRAVDAVVGRLQQQRLPAAAADLRALTGREQQIRAEQDRNADNVATQEQQEERLEAVMDAAERDGRDPATLAKATGILENALKQLPDIEDERNRIAAETRALSDDAAHIEGQQETVDRLHKHAHDADTLLEDAHRAATQAREALGTGRSTLDRARMLAQAHRRAEAELDHAHPRVAAGQKAVEETAEQDELAEKQQAAAEAALDATLRANAAAHAVSMCGPGDPCPVCARELPDTFVAPVAPDEKQARSAADAARRRATSASRAYHTATANLESRQEEVATAETRTLQARADLDQALADLTPLLGPVDLAQNDDTLLVPLTQTVHKSQAELTAADTRARAARAEATAATTTLEHERTALKERTTTLTAARRRIEQRLRKLTRTIDELPDAYHITAPLTADAIEGRLHQTRIWSDSIAATADQLGTTRHRLTELRRTREELAQRHLAQVERPATDLRHRLHALTQHVADAAALLDHTPPSTPASARVVPDARWAEDLDGTVTSLLLAAREALDDADRSSRQAAKDIDAALKQAEVNTVDQLDAVIVDVTAAAQVAETDLRRAQRETPIAADLDQRLTAATPIVNGLRELAALLANGQFPAVVVARRQRAFLGLATDQLREMTGGKFAFSDDFRIIDRHTSQPRDVKTLSGGETFQASLALALAVVDLAGRAGGRVDALFLDEGFGSLDANNLAEALDALSRQTLGGRLVTVISHMRAVAENIDNVLVVTRTAGGSQARWASATERDELADDDLSAGLLS